MPIPIEDEKKVQSIASELETYSQLAINTNTALGASNVATAELENKLQSAVAIIGAFTALGAAVGGVGVVIGAPLGLLVAFVTQFVKGKTKHFEHGEAVKIANPLSEQVEALINNLLDKKLITKTELETQADNTYNGLMMFLKTGVPRTERVNHVITYIGLTLQGLQAIEKIKRCYWTGLVESIVAGDVTRFDEDFIWYFKMNFLVKTKFDKFANGVIAKISIVVDKYTDELKKLDGKPNEIPGVEAKINPLLAIAGVGLLATILTKGKM